MQKTTSILIKTFFAVLNLVIFLGLIYLYLSNIIFYELFLALAFLQVLIISMSLSIYLFIYKRMQKLANEIGFQYLKGSFPHPKFEGYYKNNWFQLHFVSKEYGSNWGKPRLYVKLQYKELKKFDENILNKYNNFDYKDHKIIELKHIIRDYKNYLLLKREWPTFDKNKVYELMDLLLKIAEEAEIKESKTKKKEKKKKSQNLNKNY